MDPDRCMDLIISLVILAVLLTITAFWILG